MRRRTTLVEPKPANLTFEQAAAMPLAGNTALMGLRDAARVRPGQRVLINGASGGVGTFAVQIAKAFGAEVTGVCSTRNVDLVRSLGADHVIDYTREDFTRDGRRYDVVFDLVGNRSLTDCRRALTPTGTLVLSGGGVSDGGSLVGPIGLIVRGQLLSRFVRHRLVTVLTRDAEQGEPGDAAGTRRVRKGHPGHRPDLPAERGARGHPVPRGGARPREGRHHRMTSGCGRPRATRTSLD